MKLFDKDICHVTFSHTDCIDIWPIYFGEMKKYFNMGLKHFICVNSESSKIPSYINPLLYSDSDTYPKRLISCLDEISADFKYVFFDHEDMFLYDHPDVIELEKYYEVLKSGELDHIRLIKGGKCVSTQNSNVATLYNFGLESKWIFSIQPSLWRIDVLKEVLTYHLLDNVWDLERKSQETVRRINLKAAYSFKEGSNKRGYFHFENEIYPYVATAIGKGKWNIGEYEKELRSVFLEYNIDPLKRGVNTKLDAFFDNFSFLKK